MKDLTKHKEAKDTDKEIWRKVKGDFYSPSIHATERGGIGMNVGGYCIVMPIEKWHSLATELEKIEDSGVLGEEDKKTVYYKYLHSKCKSFGIDGANGVLLSDALDAIEAYRQEIALRLAKNFSVERIEAKIKPLANTLYNIQQRKTTGNCVQCGQEIHEADSVEKANKRNHLEEMHIKDLAQALHKTLFGGRG